MPSSLLRAHKLFAAIAVPWLLLACSEAPPQRDARLAIAETGTYQLNGREVAEANLKQELRNLRSAGAPVRLEIEAHHMAKFEAVGKAVQAAQDAGIDKLAFVTTPPPAAVSGSSGNVVSPQ